MKSAQNAMSLAHYARRDGEVKSTPGFIAVGRIKKLIKSAGRRGMITVSELVEADPSLAGLDRPEILDQIIRYGKFDVMEVAGDVYVSTGLKNIDVPVREIPRLRQLFIDARVRSGNPPLVAALQGGWHVDDLARERVWSLRRLVSEVGRELAVMDGVNGAIGEIRQECSRHVASDVVRVSRLKAEAAGIGWLATGLLGCILATDGSGRELHLTGKNDRRLILTRQGYAARPIPLVTLRARKRAQQPPQQPPQPPVPSPMAQRVDAWLRANPAALVPLDGESVAERRARRRERLWRRIIGVSERPRGRARPLASWQKRLLQSVR